MKKLLMLLVVMAMAAPVMATSIEFTATTDGLTVTVDYVVTDGTVRGMALNVDADVDVDAVAVDSFFDVFMDAAYGDPENYALGDGTPIASQDVAGEIALSSNMFCISMGNLEGTPEGETRTNVDQIVLTAAAAGTGTLDINTLRGAIVDTDGAAVTSNLPIDLIWEDGGDLCQDRLTAGEKADIEAYLAAGRTQAEVDSWCSQFQCRGDAALDTEGFAKLRVFGNDLAMIVANWRLKIDAADPAADVAHDAEGFAKLRVFGNDLALIVANWRLKDVDLTDCPGYVAP